MGPKPFVDGVRLHSTSALVRIHLHPPALHLTQAPPSYCERQLHLELTDT